MQTELFPSLITSDTGTTDRYIVVNGTRWHRANYELRQKQNQHNVQQTAIRRRKRAERERIRQADRARELARQRAKRAA